MRILPPSWYLPTIYGLIRNLIARTAVYPFYASFKLTSRCHFGCPFCNVKKHPGGDLSTDGVKTILRNLSRSPVLMTSFEGGEPLLREDIGELLRFARTCKFYLLFTTSARDLLDRPLEAYAKSIDFLHVSIDEGHDNLSLFDALPRLVKLPLQVSVQTVVTRDTVDALEDKVRRCHAAGANIVVIPATHMDATEDFFPDVDLLEKTMLALRGKYPAAIHTPQGYFKAYRKGACSAASVVIAPDGALYYPCHILERKGPDLRTVDLTRWLAAPEAAEGRRLMKACRRNCGWYQYYSIDSYTSIASMWETLRPAFRKRRAGGVIDDG
ncbi:MAG: radical SAM protein [Chitinispirillaceae bacterium]|nr:radical SAM protein [Chitinispirillaceae bacterium]